MNDNKKPIQEFVRALLADAENQEVDFSAFAHARHLAPMVECIRDATGSEITARQLVAIWNLHVYSYWFIGHDVLVDEAVCGIQDELVGFLSEAGLRGSHFKPPNDANLVFPAMCSALRNVRAWSQACETNNARTAAATAFRVATSIESLWVFA